MHSISLYRSACLIENHLRREIPDRKAISSIPIAFIQAHRFLDFLQNASTGNFDSTFDERGKI